MKKTIVLILAILLLLPAGGCSLRPKRSADDPFRIGFQEQTNNLNPYSARSSPEAVVLSLLYDTLFVFDPETGEIAPGLCIGQSISQNKDGSYSWDLELRDDVFWHDGRQLTAKDVMFTLKTTQLFSALYGSPNCDFFYGGNMTVIDDTHLSFVVWDDYSYMEAYLAEVPILPEHIWNAFPYMQYTESSQAADHASAMEQLRNVEADAATMIGSGPWRWGGCKDGVCRLYRNESHWNGAPALETVEILSGLMDPMEALVSGSVEAVWDLPPQDMTAAAEAGFLTGAGSVGDMLALHFNLHENSHSPLKDAALRQALDIALNREEILLQAFDGGSVEQGMMPPGIFWYYPVAEQSADLLWLLEQNGYTDRDGDGIRETSNGTPMSLELLCPNSSRWEAAAELVRQQCAAVGIGVQVLACDTMDMYRRMTAGEYDMLLTGWNTGSDPAFLFGSCYWDGGDNAFCAINDKGQMIFPGWNDTGYASEEYDSLYRQLITTDAVSERKLIVEHLGAILSRDLPMLVLGWPFQYQACGSSWVEFKSEQGGLLFTKAQFRHVLASIEIE